MRILVVGGCGLVGSLVVPYLAKRHEVTVLDLKEPASPAPGVSYHQGNVRDHPLVTELASGVETMVYMAMGPLAGWGTPKTAEGHFDVAVTGLYLALDAANKGGVRHAVYTSSMSVFRFVDPVTGEPLADDDRIPKDQSIRFPDESTQPDARDFYGLAKRLGEQVCQNAALLHGMDVTCLRLCFPVADDEWPRHDTRGHELISTSARDVASAIDAALDHQGHGFDFFNISGDADDQVMSIQKARDVLGWEPLDQTS